MRACHNHTLFLLCNALLVRGRVGRCCWIRGQSFSFSIFANLLLEFRSLTSTEWFIPLNVLNQCTMHIHGSVVEINSRKYNETASKHKKGSTLILKASAGTIA